jgi:hypothetical protein
MTMTLISIIQDLIMQDFTNDQIVNTLFSNHSSLLSTLTIEEIQDTIQKATKDLEDEIYADYYYSSMDHIYDSYDY